MSWFLMAAAGGALLYGMRWTPRIIDFILVRMAAASFAGAGLLGVDGWLGSATQAVVGWILTQIDKIGSWGLGGPVGWILCAVLGALWVGAMLPAQLFKLQYTAGIAIAGIFLPALLKSVPGQGGDALSAVVDWSGNALISAVGSVF